MWPCITRPSRVGARARRGNPDIAVRSIQSAGSTIDAHPCVSRASSLVAMSLCLRRDSVPIALMPPDLTEAAGHATAANGLGSIGEAASVPSEAAGWAGWHRLTLSKPLRRIDIVMTSAKWPHPTP
jgi:hypothetical protein